jgi:PleD family two-component response regulator
MDGFAVLAEMKKMGLTEHVRTLVFTARKNQDDVDRAVGLGARDYLSKPYEPQQLLLRVARLLIKDRSALP